MSNVITIVLFLAVILLVWAVIMKAGWYREIMKKGKYINESWLKQSQQESQQFNDNAQAANKISDKKQNLLQKWEDEKKEIQLKIEEALREKNELMEKLSKSELALKGKKELMEEYNHARRFAWDDICSHHRYSFLFNLPWHWLVHHKTY